MNALGSKTRIRIAAVLACSFWAAPSLAIEPASPVTDPSLKPWAATVWVDNKHECSASLIDPHWVLTARHCVPLFCEKGDPDPELSRVQVRVPDRPTFPPKAVVCAKEKDKQIGVLWPNDVALIRIQFVKEVNSKLPTLSQVSMTDLPSETTTLSSPVLSIGWSQGNDKPARDSAHSLELVPFSRQKCRDLLSGAATCPEPKNLLLGKTQFCAWAGKIPSSFYGLQKGDSGGPAVHPTTGLPAVVGIASEACSTGLAVFEDVSSYRQWIVDQVCGYYHKVYPKEEKKCRQRLLSGGK